MDFIRGESVNKLILGGIKLANRNNNHQILKNLISGISAIHSKGIVHQDIKGDNLMFDYNYNDGYYRFIDFGLSCVKKGNKVKKSRDNWPCGTIGTRYTSPQEIAIKNKNKFIDWKTLEAHDYWSIGIVLLRWYTFNGSQNYYSNIVKKWAKTGKEKLAHTVNAYSLFPYYYLFPEELLCSEIGKIKNHAARAIVGLLLEQDPIKRWNNFKTVKYILDPSQNLPDGNEEWLKIKSSIEDLRFS